ncbi:hypothetical protein HacjB3_13655 [Halalkalicoccus jeotgali B3]|uniref:Uncharacterized protein n=1 Tax=Halalkalicoccus jeotgali (strain DSM 18796 / CECT 7217 / JCM 14584 / KCTC 4019 / B3) TaxID=795797 RepID=D8J7U2_HALJB|nr:hypothetical protein HacjB3_13655 [Halalkalicoccus jeotgali B3]
MAGVRDRSVRSYFVLEQRVSIRPEADAVFSPVGFRTGIDIMRANRLVH